MILRSSVFPLYDCDPSFYEGIDVVHGSEELDEDGEVIGDDHSFLAVGQNFLDRKIEELAEVLEVVILKCDLQHLIVYDLLVVVAELDEVVFLPVIDHLEAFGDLIEFGMSVSVESFIPQHELHHMPQLFSADFQHVYRSVVRDAFHQILKGNDRSHLL